MECVTLCPPSQAKFVCGYAWEGGGVFLQVIAAEAGVAQKKMACFGVPYCYISKALSFGGKVCYRQEGILCLCCVLQRFLVVAGYGGQRLCKSHRLQAVTRATACSLDSSPTAFLAPTCRGERGSGQPLARATTCHV